MGNTGFERAVKARQAALHRAVGEELRRVRLDAGVSIRAVSQAAGLDPSHLARIEHGEREPSLDALAAIATALGHDASIRLFPSTGPWVRDHLQTRMIEGLLDIAHPRWIARLEVGVYRPVHGIIDLVLQDRAAADVVAAEAHSGLHAVEHQLRWAGQKADALPSARGWPWAGGTVEPRIGRLLLLRSTAATRSLAADLPHLFRAAYPVPSSDAWDAIVGDATPWPGAAILWVDVHGARTRILRGSPRGVPR
jgi:transcriptional regulator with XRE-family HTH domain